MREEIRRDENGAAPETAESSEPQPETSKDMEEMERSPMEYLRADEGEVEELVLSCLLAIQNLQAESGYVMKFLKNYTALVNTGKQLYFAGFLVTLVLKVMNKQMK